MDCGLADAVVSDVRLASVLSSRLADWLSKDRKRGSERSLRDATNRADENAVVQMTSEWKRD